MKLTEAVLEMLHEITISAREADDYESFVQKSKLSLVSPGKSHEDRMRLLYQLIEDGSIFIRDGKLEIVRGSLPNLLDQAIADGYESSWEDARHYLGDESLETKYDYLLLHEIGLKGELAFIKYLEAKYGESAKINHVSLFDDSAGYDISVVFESGQTRFYEVKTSSRASKASFEFFLSRNEMSVGESTNTWEIACIILDQGEAEYLGRIQPATLIEHLPKDISSIAAWSSVKFKFPRNLIQKIEMV